jgi:hypothetical protein
VVRGADALAEHLAALDGLAAAAAEPNVFYEPWLLLPAVKAFGAGTDLRFALIHARDQLSPDAPATLAGFFPLERENRFRGLPVSVLRLWKHRHCFLGTPLVRRGLVGPCLEAFFRWLAADRAGAPLVEMPYLAAGGPCEQAVAELCIRRGLRTEVHDRFERALLSPAASAEAYLSAALSTGARKELRRQRRRLGELGKLETRLLEREEDVPAWAEQFLDLEAAGWKGHAGGALRHTPGGPEFFRAALAEAYRRGRLLMLGLFLDGRPVALKCSFTAGEGAFAYKIAFDEAFARFSPGVQLELDNVALVHDRPALRWMDSCASANHPMIDRLWTERRAIHTVLASTGRVSGNLLLRLLPVGRWLRRRLRGNTTTAAPEPVQETKPC